MAAAALLIFTVLFGLLVRTRTEMRKVEQIESKLLVAIFELEINTVEITLGTNSYWHGDLWAPIQIDDDIADFKLALQTLQSEAHGAILIPQIQQVSELHARAVAAYRKIRAARPDTDRKFKTLRDRLTHLNLVMDRNLQLRESQIEPQQMTQGIDFESDIDRYGAELYKLLSDNSTSALQQHRDLEAQLLVRLPSVATALFPNSATQRADFLQAGGELLNEGRELRKTIQHANAARRQMETAGLALDEVLDEHLQPALSRRMQASLDAANDSVSTALAVFILLLLGVALIWHFTSKFLGQRILSPIIDLGDSLRKIGDGDLDTRAQIHFDDEIGQLAHRFNNTASALSVQTIARAHLNDLLGEVADYVIACDSDNRIVFVSPHLLDRLDYDLSALTGQPLTMLLKFPTSAGPESPEVLLTHVPMLDEIRSRDGKWYPVHLIATRLGRSNDLGYTLIGRDRSAEVAAHERLQWLQRLIRNAQDLLSSESAARQELELQLLDIAEREQARIGQELHDDVGQQMAGAAFLGHALHVRLQAAGRPEAEDASWISAVLAQSLDSLRGISRDLSPTGMESGDLAESLHALCARTERLYGIQCNFILAASGPAVAGLPSVLARNLFRIAQEAVNNALRHGKATTIAVVLRLRLTHGSLSLEDNGLGFEVEDASGGIGLRNIRMRSHGIGGRARIRSVPDRTLVLVRFPLKWAVADPIESKSS